MGPGSAWGRKIGEQEAAIPYSMASFGLSVWHSRMASQKAQMARAQALRSGSTFTYCRIGAVRDRMSVRKGRRPKAERGRGLKRDKREKLTIVLGNCGQGQHDVFMGTRVQAGRKLLEDGVDDMGGEAVRLSQGDQDLAGRVGPVVLSSLNSALLDLFRNTDFDGHGHFLGGQVDYQQDQLFIQFRDDARVGHDIIQNP